MSDQIYDKDKPTQEVASDMLKQVHGHFFMPWPRKPLGKPTPGKGGISRPPSRRGYGNKSKSKRSGGFGSMSWD